MSTNDLSWNAWRTSSYSGGGNDCVEVAYRTDGAALRDSKARAAGAMLVGHTAWYAMLATVRAAPH